MHPPIPPLNPPLTGPPIGVRCRNFGQKFGQFRIFWAILRQNFKQFCLLTFSERWTETPSQFERRPLFFFKGARSPQIGQKNRFNFSEDLFFWRSPQYGHNKRLICQATFKSFFGQNFGLFVFG